MKRIVLIVGILMFTLVAMTQEKHHLEEVNVRMPVYNEEQLSENYGPQTFSELLSTEIIDMVNKGMFAYDEGTVVVDFTVYTDGTIGDFIIQNSVSGNTDNVLIGVLKSTSGDWLPGSNDGAPVEMQKRVVVGFEDLETPSLSETAISFFNSGIKQYLASECISKNPYVAPEKREARTERRLKYALANFEKALRYAPNEYSVVFWQAKVYERLGDSVSRDMKLMEAENIAGDFNSNAYAVIVQLK